MQFTKDQLKCINEKDKNIIVSAGAGSGKTAVLTERILQKLINKVDLDNIIIITFTNAAAFEMKKRIEKKIKANVDKYPYLKEQLLKINDANICTFDALFLKYVKKYAYTLNLDNDIKIIDSTLMKNKLNEIIKEEINLRKNDEQFKKYYMLFSSYDNNFNNVLLDYYYFYQKQDNNLASIYNLVGKDEELIDDLRKENQELIANLFLSSEELDEVNNYIEEIYKENTKARCSILEKEIKDKLKANIKLEKEIKKHNVNEEIKYTNEFKEYFDELMKSIDEKVYQFKVEKMSFSYDDIFMMLMKIFEDEKILSEFKENICEIMVDEYQDTNKKQNDFLNLIANNNLFLVGDVKQSIYGFRDSDPKYFIQRYLNYKNSDEGIAIDLKQNFRSCPEIINDINTFFSLKMSEEVGGINYDESQMMDINNLYPENNDNGIKLIEYQKNDDEKEDKLISYKVIITDILNKIKNNYQIYDREINDFRNLKYSDITILTRDKTIYLQVKKLFNDNNIPLTTQEAKNFKLGISHVIFKNILQLIFKNNTYKTEKHLVFSVLRSFLYNVCDEELYLLRDLKYLSDLKDTKYNDLYFKIKDIQKNINHYNYQELFETIIKEFNFIDKLMSVNNLIDERNNLINFLKLAITFDELGLNDKEVIDYLNNDFDVEIKHEFHHDVDAVSIMTIHNSKGLEFPLVYLVDKEETERSKDNQVRFGYNKNYGIYHKDNPIKDDEGFYIKTMSLIHLLNKKEQKIEKKSEQIRLIYVALTRTIQQLNIIVEKNSYFFNADFKKILFDNDDICLEYKQNIDLNANNINDNFIDEIIINKENIIKNRASKNIINVLSSSEIKNINYGNEMHNKLSLLNKDNNYVLKTIKDLVNTNCEEIINYLPEYEFFDDINNINGIIDLLIETKNYFVIIDYKLDNIDDEAYEKQLTCYKEYIEKNTDKKIKAYLYSINKKIIKEITF